MSIMEVRNLINRALDQDEIRSAAQQANISPAKLRSSLRGKLHAIFESATQEINVCQRLYERVQELEEEVEAAEDEYRHPFQRARYDLMELLNKLEREGVQDLSDSDRDASDSDRDEPDSDRDESDSDRDVSDSILLRYLLPFLVTLTALVAVLGGLFTLLGFYVGWSTVLGWTTVPVVMAVATIFVTCAVGIAILSAYITNPERGLERRKAEVHRRLTELAEAEIEAVTAYRAENPKPVELVESRAALDAAREAAHEAIIQYGIVPELRATINARLKPSYDAVLTVSKAAGLAEIPNPEYEIVTDARMKLEQLFKSMPGGSIGVAGPRGAGKSTLLRVFCEMSPEEMRQRGTLSVMTSAPVEYVAREFILHVFALVCQKALLLQGAKRSQPSESMSQRQRANTPSVGPSLLTKLIGPSEVKILGAVGTVLLTVSLLLAYLASKVAAPAILAKADSLLEVLSLYAELLGIKPAPVFYLGLLCVVLSCVGVIVLRRQSRSRLQQERTPREEEGKVSSYRARFVDAMSGEYDSGFVAEANRCLDEIRWQQSYSSGWGGSLKLAPVAPVVAEAKEEASMSLARNQLSLPEIVKQYEDFLGIARAKYKVIVGIDELDKLQSNEQAERFMNEIKALFGLPHCFYLLSVSENAMSSFDRRDVRFRDVFDSSFDDIIYVDYLDPEQARNLLRRRVIGMPVPFLDLCYCMSGGLARDLIRVCRTLFQARRTEETENTLAALSESMVRADIHDKLRATSIAARDATTEREADELFRIMRKLEVTVGNGRTVSDLHSELLSSCKSLLSDITAHPTSSAARQPYKAVTRLLRSLQQLSTGDVAGESEKSTSLRTELGVYLYYMLTLLQFFAGPRGPKTSGDEYDSDAIHRLARVRQLLSENPHFTRSELTTIRESYDLDTA
jgi:hypothetical protein